MARKMREVLKDPWKEWNTYKVNLKEHFEKFFPLILQKLNEIELLSHFMEMWHYDKYTGSSFRPYVFFGISKYYFQEIIERAVKY